MKRSVLNPDTPLVDSSQGHHFVFHIHAVRRHLLSYKMHEFAFSYERLKYWVENPERLIGKIHQTLHLDREKAYQQVLRHFYKALPVQAVGLPWGCVR
ncbi:hypothetical protein DJ56_3577 [Yersinia pestis]|nr:hypothetical protein DJ56_3577 [Yersinia pestis]